MFFCCAPPTHCDLTRRFVSCRRRHLLRSAGGTYRIPGQVCLLMYSLVLTCVVCLEIEESSITCTWRQTKLVPFCKTPGFPHRIRLPSTTYIYIRSRCLNPGNFRAFNLIQGRRCIRTLKKQYRNRSSRAIRTPSDACCCEKTRNSNL